MIINLLPEKQNNGMYIKWFSGLLALLLAAGSSWIGVQYYVSHKRLETLEERLAAVSKERAQVEDSVKGRAISAAAMSGIIGYSPGTTAGLLKNFISLLHANGRFLGFEYGQPHQMNLLVQFDTLEDVSAYYRRLKGSKMIEKARLAKVSSSSGGAYHIAEYAVTITETGGGEKGAKKVER